jgi:DNA-directed RNA polymerase subunit K/omega
MQDDGETRDDDDSRVEQRRKPILRAANEIEDDIISIQCGGSIL